MPPPVPDDIAHILESNPRLVDPPSPGSDGETDGELMRLTSLGMRSDAAIRPWIDLARAIRMVQLGLHKDVAPILDDLQPVFRQRDQPVGMGYLWMVRAFSQLGLSDPYAAMASLRESNVCFEIGGDSLNVRRVRVEKLRIALELGLIHTATSMAARLVDPFERDSVLTASHVDAWLGQGLVRLRIGRTAEALPWLARAMVAAETLGLREGQLEISLAQSDAYLAVGDLPAARLALDRYIGLLKELGADPDRDVRSAGIGKPMETDYDWKDLLSGLVILSAAIYLIFRNLRTQHPPDTAESAIADLVAPVENSDADVEFEYDKLADLFQRIQALLEADAIYRMPRLTISDVAFRLGTNDKYVSQAVNAYAGMSFIQLVNEYRLRHARTLLAKHGRRANSRRIAAESGFGSVSSFHRVFKADTGLTPVEWVRKPSPSVS